MRRDIWEVDICGPIFSYLEWVYWNKYFGKKIDPKGGVRVEICEKIKSIA